MPKTTPVVMQVYEGQNKTYFLTARDWDQARIMVLTFAVLIMWKIIQWGWDLLKGLVFGKVKKTDDKLDMLVDGHNEMKSWFQSLEAKVDKSIEKQSEIEEKIVPKHEIYDMVKSEIHYYDKLKGKSK